MDIQARNEWVTENIAIAGAVVKRYHWGGWLNRSAYDDLRQEAAIGMLTGYEKWDGARGSSRATVAYWWARAGAWGEFRHERAAFHLCPLNIETTNRKHEVEGPRARGGAARVLPRRRSTWDTPIGAGLDGRDKTLADLVGDDSAVIPDQLCHDRDARNVRRLAERAMARAEAFRLLERERAKQSDKHAVGKGKRRKAANLGSIVTIEAARSLRAGEPISRGAERAGCSTQAATLEARKLLELARKFTGGGHG